MIAEDNILHPAQADIELPKNRVIRLIQQCMVETVVHFKSAHEKKFHPNIILNEDKLTQLYIQHAQILIRNRDYPFNIGGQYQDFHSLSKGIPDIYFYANQHDSDFKSLYSVECKRLPSPGNNREKEYVIGDNNNGGIERYKSEKHGKGLQECGMVGFVEHQDFNHWHKAINSWIVELAAANETLWKEGEVLSEQESNNDYCILQSIAHRTGDDIQLTHLWIDCKKVGY